MPEVDLRGNPWGWGYPREEQLINRDLYALLAIFGASETLSSLRTAPDAGDVYGWSIRSFEYPEISRILVGVAAMLRNDWDANPGRIEQLLSNQDDRVGELAPDIENPTEVTALRLRESFNKIIHAVTINLDRSDPSSIISGHLNPVVHLYGEKGDSVWKASLDIYHWAELSHCIA